MSNFRLLWRSSGTEALCMEVELIGNKVELSRELDRARASEIRAIYKIRECYIDELRKRPEQLQTATKNID